MFTYVWSTKNSGVGVASKNMSYYTISHVSAAWKNQTMHDQHVQFSQCNSLNRLNQYIEAAKKISMEFLK